MNPNSQLLYPQGCVGPLRPSMLAYPVTQPVLPLQPHDEQQQQQLQQQQAIALQQFQQQEMAIECVGDQVTPERSSDPQPDSTDDDEYDEQYDLSYQLASDEVREARGLVGAAPQVGWACRIVSSLQGKPRLEASPQGQLPSGLPVRKKYTNLELSVLVGLSNLKSSPMECEVGRSGKQNVPLSAQNRHVRKTGEPVKKVKSVVENTQLKQQVSVTRHNASGNMVTVTAQAEQRMQRKKSFRSLICNITKFYDCRYCTRF